MSRTLRVFSLVAMLTVSACTVGADGVLVVKNSSAQQVDVRVNVIRGVKGGRFMSAPATSFDQLYHLEQFQPGASTRIGYRSSSEYDIDVLATWPDGHSSRFDVGYVTDDSFVPHHEIEITDSTILVDGKPPVREQSSPETRSR